jgi:hypothetical protein
MGFARLGDPGTRAHAARTWGTPTGMWYKEPGFLEMLLLILAVAGAKAHHFSTLCPDTKQEFFNSLKNGAITKKAPTWG